MIWFQFTEILDFKLVVTYSENFPPVCSWYVSNPTCTKTGSVKHCQPTSVKGDTVGYPQYLCARNHTKHQSKFYNKQWCQAYRDFHRPGEMYLLLRTQFVTYVQPHSPHRENNWPELPLKENESVVREWLSHGTRSPINHVKQDCLRYR